MMFNLPAPLVSAILTLLIASPSNAAPSKRWNSNGWLSSSWSKAATPDAATNATSSYNPKTHLVVVGGAVAGLVYTPPVTYADVGDIVVFKFESKNHTVVQSAFPTPCTSLLATTGVGFDSGFLPAMDNSTSSPAFIVTVEDTKPIWFYCKQMGHCPKGMVGAINPPKEGNTFDKFKAEALALAPPASSTSSSAAPAPTSTWVPKLKCDVEGQNLPLPGNQNELLPPPGQLPRIVALGRGTQNYTCTSGKFVNIGAVASLFDMSCILPNPAPLSDAGLITQIASLLPLSNPVGNVSFAQRHFGNQDVDFVANFIQGDHASPAFLGEHTFTELTVAGKKGSFAKFDMSQVLKNPQDFITANKTASIPDPTDPTNNVAWVELGQKLEGELASTVYRVKASGGQPPASCNVEGSFLEVDYAAEYWFEA